MTSAGSRTYGGQHVVVGEDPEAAVAAGQVVRRARPGTAARARRCESARKRAPAASAVRWTPCSTPYAVSSISAVGCRAVGAHAAAVGADLDEPADERDRRAGDAAARRAGAAWRRPRRAIRSTTGGTSRLHRKLGRGADQAADQAPQEAEGERVAGRDVDLVASESATDDREGEHPAARTARRPRAPSRAASAAPRPRSGAAAERVAQISAPSGIASSISGWMRRAEPTISGLWSSTSIGVRPRADRLPERLGDEVRVDPDEPDERDVRRDQRDDQAGDEHDPRRHRPGDQRRDDPGQREPLAEQARELARVRVDRPIRSGTRRPRRLRSAAGSRPAALGELLGARRSPAERRRRDRLRGHVLGGSRTRSRGAGGGGGSRRAGRGRWAAIGAPGPRRPGSSGVNGAAAAPSGGGSARRRGGGRRPHSAVRASTWNSSWRAPQDGQKRARALMRVPQLGQKIVSLTWFPVASPRANGYHLPPMDARVWMVRLALGAGLAGGFAAVAQAQTPTPTPTAALPRPARRRSCWPSTHRARCAPTTATGRAKIDAAKEAAVALLGTLPDSTQLGLRVYGGTLPSRPIDAACKDSTLVLPIGRVDRGERRGEDPLVQGARAHADRLRARRRRRTTSATAARARSCSSPTARTPASRRRRAGRRARSPRAA